MEEKFKKVIEQLKNETEKACYKIEIIDEIPKIKDDKIGGMPYLPLGENYPTDKKGDNMALLIQVNLKNIDLPGYPKKGILEVFTDKECTWPCEYEIRYFEDGLEYQTSLEEVSLENYITTNPLKIELKKDIEHMSMNDYRFNNYIIPIVNKIFNVELKNFIDVANFFEKNDVDLFDMIYDNCTIHAGNIGGYADFTQSDPRVDMKENKDECLIKIDSNLGHGIMIGDSGIIFVLISQKDIENCNFANAIVDWDCC